MTLAEWAYIAQIVASVTAIVALVFIARQTKGIKEQAVGIKQQVEEFARQGRIQRAYEIIIRYGEPQYREYFRRARSILKDQNLSPAQKLQKLKDPNDDFSYNFAILACYMENLANLYLNGHVDERLVKWSLYSPVKDFFKEAEKSEVIDELRKGQPTCLKLWQDLADQWTKEGPPY